MMGKMVLPEIKKLKILIPGADVDVLEVLYDEALAFLLTVTHREAVDIPDNLIRRIVSIFYNQLGSDGLSAESYAGVSQSFMTGLPEDVKAQIKSIRKVVWS